MLIFIKNQNHPDIVKTRFVLAGSTVHAWRRARIETNRVILKLWYPLLKLWYPDHQHSEDGLNQTCT